MPSCAMSASPVAPRRVGPPGRSPARGRRAAAAPFAAALINTYSQIRQCGLFVPKPSCGPAYQRRRMCGLRQTVRGCPLTSAVGHGDCHSLRHSVAVRARAAGGLTAAVMAAGWLTRLTVVREPRASMRARSYHASPGGAKASLLWIALWMLSANRLVNRCEAVDKRGCGKVDNGEDASLAQVRKPLLSTRAMSFRSSA